MSCFIIAEIGVNHNGSLDLAKKHIEMSAKAGADAAKFQTFKAEHLATSAAPKAEYQKRRVSQEGSQQDMLAGLELSEPAHLELAKFCASLNIEFMSSPFHVGAVSFLVDTVGVRRLKIPSGEITNLELLLQAARKKRPVILSTGMSVLGEIETALGALAFGYVAGTSEKPTLDAFRAAFISQEGFSALQSHVTILQCTTEYPSPYTAVNLRGMATIREAFGLPVGLSDHTVGTAVPIGAVALGATIIEKHVTLDKKLPGPDHAASLEPGELDMMVSGIRQVEAALGHARKVPAAAELENAKVARKSLVAIAPITQGAKLTPENLGTKRPGTGISAALYHSFLGRAATRDYAPDELIDEAGIAQ